MVFQKETLDYWESKETEEHFSAPVLPIFSQSEFLQLEATIQFENECLLQPHSATCLKCRSFVSWRSGGRLVTFNTRPVESFKVEIVLIFLWFSLSSSPHSCSQLRERIIVNLLSHIFTLSAQKVECVASHSVCVWQETVLVPFCFVLFVFGWTMVLKSLI